MPESTNGVVGHINLLSRILGREFTRYNGGQISTGRISKIVFHNGCKTAVLSGPFGTICVASCDAPHQVSDNLARITLGERDTLYVTNPRPHHLLS